MKEETITFPQGFDSFIVTLWEMYTHYDAAMANGDIRQTPLGDALAYGGREVAIKMMAGFAMDFERLHVDMKWEGLDYWEKVQEYFDARAFALPELDGYEGDWHKYIEQRT